jgi:hypothetical protein
MILQIYNRKYKLHEGTEKIENGMRDVAGAWLPEMVISIEANDQEETWGAVITREYYSSNISGRETPQDAFEAALIAMNIELQLKNYTYIEFLKYKKK